MTVLAYQIDISSRFLLQTSWYYYINENIQKNDEKRVSIIDRVEFKVRVRVSKVSAFQAYRIDFWVGFFCNHRDITILMKIYKKNDEKRVSVIDRVEFRVRVRVSRVSAFQAYRIDILSWFLMQTSWYYYINENIQKKMTKNESRLSI